MPLQEFIDILHCNAVQRPKAKDVVLMLKVDKFLRLWKQTRGKQFIQCSNISEALNAQMCSYSGLKYHIYSKVLIPQHQQQFGIYCVKSSVTFLFYIPCTDDMWMWDTRLSPVIISQSEARICKEYGMVWYFHWIQCTYQAIKILCLQR